MCFSAPASFVAGAALTATGVLTTKEVKNKKALPFASIPFLFGIQQLIDGIAWISFGFPLLNTIAAYGYAFFAYALWPMFVPFTVLQYEPDKKRKPVLRALLALGIVTGGYALYLMSTGPVVARIVNSCVRYDLAEPYWLPMLLPYFLATCGAFLVSSRRFVNWFGIVILISSGIAGWFYFEVFASVWCFFAAILSGMIYLHFRD